MNSLVYVELKNIHLCPKFLVLYAKLYSIGTLFDTHLQILVTFGHTLA